MTFRPALLATAALAVALCTTLAVCRRGGGGNEDLFALAQVVQHGEELARPREAGLRRIETRLALAAEVVAGRMSVREAAGHFRRLDEANPGVFAHGLPPPRDEESFCASVLDWVWVVLGHQQLYAAAKASA